MLKDIFTLVVLLYSMRCYISMPLSEIHINTNYCVPISDQYLFKFVLHVQAAKEARYDKEGVIKFFRMVCFTIFDIQMISGIHVDFYPCIHAYVFLCLCHH